jgi:hypothetical protein
MASFQNSRPSNGKASSFLKRFSFIGVLVLFMSTWGLVQAGTIVSAKCDACGYENGRIFLFGGKANLKTVCRFPAYCPEKKSLILINLMSEKAEEECPGYISYTDPKLIQNPGSKTIASWNLPEPKNISVRLTDGDYLCPRCGQFRFHFKPIGYWD